MFNKDLTAEQLRELLDYDPETGIFKWRVSRKGVTAGTTAGCCSGKGYIQIRLLYRRYYAHRLAWLHFYGGWPPGEVDHVNLSKNDNRIINLRIATRAQNIANSNARLKNKVQRKGVKKINNRYVARIYIAGEEKYLGIFKTLQEAGDAYDKAAAMEYGDFARRGG